MNRSIPLHSAVVLCALSLTASGARAAEVIQLGGGWEAIVQDRSVLDLVVDFVSLEQNILVIEKFANFTAIEQFTGKPMPLNITFRQVESDAQTVSRIVITDEAVFNNTGLTWSGFDMMLFGGNAMFNAELSSDFSHEPFTTMSFSDDLRRVSFGGGTIEDGGFWFPGVLSGGLVIDADLSATAPNIFTFKELPLVPAPAGLSLLLLGTLTAGRRRRR